MGLAKTHEKSRNVEISSKGVPEGVNSHGKWRMMAARPSREATKSSREDWSVRMSNRAVSLA